MEYILETDAYYGFHDSPRKINSWHSRDKSGRSPHLCLFPWHFLETFLEFYWRGATYTMPIHMYLHFFCCMYVQLRILKLLMSNVIQSIGNLQIFSLLITWVVRPLARPSIKAPNQVPQSSPPIKALNPGPKSPFLLQFRAQLYVIFPRFLPVFPVCLCRRHRQKP